MIGNEIRDELYRLQDIGYREFQIRLLPTVPPETVIGVRTPALRTPTLRRRILQEVSLLRRARKNPKRRKQPRLKLRRQVKNRRQPC